MDFYSLITFVSFIATVLNVILFFKIWGMTTDVKKIAEAVCNKKEEKQVKRYATIKTTGDEVEIIGMTSGKYRCVRKDTNTLVGIFAEDELKMW